MVIRKYLEEYVKRLEKKSEETTTEILERLNVEEELERIPDERALKFGDEIVKRHAKSAVRH